MLNLRLKEAVSKKGLIEIEIQNNSQKPLMLFRDIILLDGFTSDKFQVADKTTQSTLLYKGRLVKYRPTKIKLDENDKLISKLDLKDVYDLERCHQYEIVFKTLAVVDENTISLSGALNIEIEC
jgi:hypothetical protein